jgi:glycosyltransferase involved in cell wall biosynthesis
MKFSIVIPSYLGQYRNAAKNRDTKILRAINSVLNQTFQDFEVIVISDGCQKTIDIVSRIEDTRVNCYYIEKTKTWSGEPRNAGIEVAKGDFILYLDVDDLYGENHLKNISTQLGTYDWVWFDDIRYAPKLDEWYANRCLIQQMGKHGTSNICHKRSLPYKWDHVGYAHDYYFIKHLRQNTNFAKIEGGEYYVMHVPDSTLGKGYDL